MTREWVETQRFVPMTDDKDRMTQPSTSSKPCQTTNKSDNVFGDLDPLVNFKRNKTTTPSK
jgi:hypothetical protein